MNNAEPATVQPGAKHMLLGFLQLNDFVNPEAWRSAMVECIATATFVFGSIFSTVSCVQTSASPMTGIAILHFLIVTFLILAAAPSSGGHLNPCISFIAMVLGHIPPTRLIMYAIAQCVGSVFGSLSMKLILSSEIEHKLSLGACIINNGKSGLTIESAFFVELACTFILIYIVATVAMDPYRVQVAGPILAPMLIAAAVGVLVFLSGGLAPGYTGAGMNPARCFGPALIMSITNSSKNVHNIWHGHWIFWVAPCLASISVAVFYCLIPPHHIEIYRGKQDFVSRLKAALQTQA